MASFPYTWSRRQLILLSTMRIALVPLLLLCCAPRSQPIIAGETPAFIFSAALGITNGLAGSLPMMLAPAKVPAVLKEVTGNMMTLSYNVGLTAGSLIGYVFDSMLGPQIANPCPSYPYISMPPSMLNVTSTTFASVMKTSTSNIVRTTASTLLPKISPTTTTVATTTLTSVVTTTLATLFTTIIGNAVVSDDLRTASTPATVYLATTTSTFISNNVTAFPVLNMSSH